MGNCSECVNTDMRRLRGMPTASTLPKQLMPYSEGKQRTEANCVITQKHALFQGFKADSGLQLLQLKLSESHHRSHHLPKPHLAATSMLDVGRHADRNLYAQFNDCSTSCLTRFPSGTRIWRSTRSGLSKRACFAIQAKMIWVLEVYS